MKLLTNLLTQLTTRPSKIFIKLVTFEYFPCLPGPAAFPARLPAYVRPLRRVDPAGRGLRRQQGSRPRQKVGRLGNSWS